MFHRHPPRQYLIPMANLNNVISKVLSIIQNRIDGDAVLLIDQHMSDALKTTCKQIAELKPKGHESLLLTQSITYSSVSEDENTGYYTFAFSAPAYPFVQTDRFQRFTIGITTGLLPEELYRAMPVNSPSALELAGNHGVPYYFIEHPQVVFNPPSALSSVSQLTSIDITAYIYATIDQFPDKLEDLLVANLVRLIQNEPNKAREEKNEV